MSNKSIIPIIIDNYDYLTAVEKEIADYFLENRSIDDFSVKSIKNKLYVSEASLTRFAQKLGFRGYREFIYLYESDFIKFDKSFSVNFQSVINIYNNQLEQMMELADEQQIIRIVEKINNSNNIAVTGIGSSGLVAQEIKSRFARLGIIVDAIFTDDDIRMLSVIQEQGSLMIGISVSGIKDSVVFGLKNAKKNGAGTILITSNNTISYSFVDETVIVPNNKNLNFGDSISPQIPILIFIDVLYRYYRENDLTHTRSLQNHAKTISTFDLENDN